jgi:regulator of sirC expression with transglutaminase-like and TPR domain
MAVRSEVRFDERLAAFGALMKRPEPLVDAAVAASYLTCLKNPDWRPEDILARLDALAWETQLAIPRETSTERRAAAISRYLFEEQGFHGNSENYYDPRNSFLNEVLDRRLGIPISLSLVFIEVAKRLDVTCEGVGFPGHFLVRHVSAEGVALFDPFNGGRMLTEPDCAGLLKQVYGPGVPLRPEFLRPVGRFALLARMLNNLKGIAVKAPDWRLAARVARMMLHLAPDDADLTRDCGLYHIQIEEWSRALDLLVRSQEMAPENDHRTVIDEEIGRARVKLARWN